MIVTFPNGQREVPLYDLGGVPVVWQPGIGVVQDPSAGGTNAYHWPDVLTDGEGGRYQIGQDWVIRPYAGPPPAPPLAPAVPGVVAPTAPAGGGAGVPAASNPAAKTGETLGTTIGTLTNQLGTTYEIAGLRLPLVSWIGLPAGVWWLKRRRKER